jgi:hypothetical protein
MTYLLPRIPYLRLRVELRALDRAFLPPFRGSLLRGAFGNALRRSVCAFGPGQSCASCPLRAACVYTRLFESYLEGEPPPLLRGVPTAPRPLVVEPEILADPGDTADAPRDLAPGDPLRFDLLLVGRTVDLQAYALLAIERLAGNGLGRTRARFAVQRVSALDVSGSWRSVVEDGRPAGRGILKPAFPSADALPGDRLRLRFLTPTRLPSKNERETDPGFPALAFAMLRRTLELAWVHVPGAAVDWRFRPLLDQAHGVRISASDLRWQDQERYSARQRRTMTFGGFVGTMELEGDLAPFAPLLRTAEILHVGKGATFGLGRFAVGVS